MTRELISIRLWKKKKQWVYMTFFNPIIIINQSNNISIKKLSQIHIIQITIMIMSSGTAAYDEAGNTSSVTDPFGNTACFNWDFDRGILNNSTDPKGSTTSYTYDQFSDAMLSVEANGVMLTMIMSTTGWIQSAIIRQPIRRITSITVSSMIHLATRPEYLSAVRI